MPHDPPLPSGKTGIGICTSLMCDHCTHTWIFSNEFDRQQNAHQDYPRNCRMKQTTLLLFILSRFFQSQFWPIQPVWFSLWAEASTRQTSILGPPGLNCTPTTMGGTPGVLPMLIIGLKTVCWVSGMLQLLLVWVTVCIMPPSKQQKGPRYVQILKGWILLKLEGCMVCLIWVKLGTQASHG